MEKLKKFLRVLVVASLILLLPISAMAMGYPVGDGGSNGGSTSVPEPLTLLLLAAGGGIMLIKGLRKKK